MDGFLVLAEDAVKIGRVIGRGAEGIVYEASMHGAAVCCKTLHALVDPELYDARPGSTNHAHIIANLKSEAVLLTSLRHPNIVSFLGMIVTGVPRLPKYLVFEVARGTLGAHLAGLPAPPSMQDLIGYAKDILSALAYIHTPAPGREAIVHRDLKPDNVLVFPGPTASRPILKISDVGLARHFAGSLGMSIGGTMFYMAPEMLSGRFDMKVDVFSFGFMFCELVMVYIPDPVTRAVVPAREVMTRYPMDRRLTLVQDAVARLKQLCPGLADVIKWCCEDRPAARATASAAFARVSSVVVANTVVTPAPSNPYSEYDVPRPESPLYLSNEPYQPAYLEYEPYEPPHSSYEPYAPPAPAYEPYAPVYPLVTPSSPVTLSAPPSPEASFLRVISSRDSQRSLPLLSDGEEEGLLEDRSGTGCGCCVALRHLLWFLIINCTTLMQAYTAWGLIRRDWYIDGGNYERSYGVALFVALGCGWALRVYNNATVLYATLDDGCCVMLCAHVLFILPGLAISFPPFPKTVATRSSGIGIPYALLLFEAFPACLAQLTWFLQRYGWEYPVAELTPSVQACGVLSFVVLLTYSHLAMCAYRARVATGERWTLTRPWYGPFWSRGRQGNRPNALESIFNSVDVIVHVLRIILLMTLVGDRVFLAPALIGFVLIPFCAGRMCGRGGPSSHLMYLTGTAPLLYAQRWGSDWRVRWFGVWLWDHACGTGVVVALWVMRHKFWTLEVSTLLNSHLSFGILVTVALHQVLFLLLLFRASCCAQREYYSEPESMYVRM